MNCWDDGCRQSPSQSSIATFSPLRYLIVIFTLHTDNPFLKRVSQRVNRRGGYYPVYPYLLLFSTLPILHLLDLPSRTPPPLCPVCTPLSNSEAEYRFFLFLACCCSISQRCRQTKANEARNTSSQPFLLSHLSTSTMDEDVLSDFHRCSLSGTDSLLTDITEYEPIERGDSCPKWAGLTARNRFSQSYDKNQDCYSSQEGEGDAAFNANELMPVRSTMQAPTRPPESAANRPCRDVEHLGVKQTVEVLQSIPGSPHLQRSFTFDREQLDEPGTIVERAISDKEKKSKISTLFARAASNGDISRIIEILDNFRDWVDINTHEEDGSTPLIYAACFGQTAVVFMLLDAGAQVDARDKFGWTALVWATNNKHEDIVRLLLDHGASPSAQTVKGRTVADFLRHDPNDTTKIAQIFREPTTTRSNFASKSPFMRANAALMNQDQFYQEIMTEDERQHRLNMGSSQNLVDDMTENDRFLSDQVRIVHVVLTRMTTTSSTGSCAFRTRCSCFRAGTSRTSSKP
ncbi:hypothetical protein BC939DRAFT_189366 [Gamsiella multidivaricata]|uniref:uncharacterized protein n=1 Tax=Gamsiella multidivaricata TaxID=101098 RepID=UPI0022202C62|nr:uncharacterized protein BC939DRAFT_189366 [Gamsiella multidivaricata]KAI7831549.1 hypothetical protein BC939DRAFT_189366 [Gamsiella multidivaricata]